MIKIPYEEIILKINERTNISISEIEERVDKKLKQLSGLISKEGAAHIVANELGVKIFEPLSGRLQIKNVLSGMRDVETVGKVLQVYDVKEFMRGEAVSKVASILIGDETGAIRVVMWGSQAENVAKFLWRTGINTRLLYAQGYGGCKLVERNSGSENSENYRIEITLEKLPV